MQTRREIIQAMSAAPLAARIGVSSPIRRDRPPNVILIVSDQHIGSVMGHLGDTDAKTPHLDRLAASGTSYTLSYCASPACCPSRASLFTGRATNETAVLINPMPIASTIPDLGQWIAHHTGAKPLYFGKWHIPGRNVEESFSVLSHGGARGETGDLLLANEFESYLRNHDPEVPYVAVLAPLNPHDICEWPELRQQCGPSIRDAFANVPLPVLPPSFNVPVTEPAGYRAIRRKANITSKWDTVDWQLYRWTYLRYLSMLDHAVGRMVAVLNKQTAADTVVIYTSDHGEMAGSHSLIQKGDLYEAASRVPFIVSWPGVVESGVIDSTHLVSALDIVPTICDVLEIPHPPAQRGRSLVPLWRDHRTPWRTHLQVQTLVEGRMVRTEAFKHVQWRGEETEQLFHLASDPHETNNLAGDPAASSIVAAMRELQAQSEAALTPAPGIPANYIQAKASLRSSARTEDGE